jgi:hypothetical protein
MKKNHNRPFDAEEKDKMKQVLLPKNESHNVVSVRMSSPWHTLSKALEKSNKQESSTGSTPNSSEYHHKSSHYDVTRSKSRMKWRVT